MECAHLDSRSRMLLRAEAAQAPPGQRQAFVAKIKSAVPTLDFLVCNGKVVLTDAINKYREVVFYDGCDRHNLTWGIEAAHLLLRWRLTGSGSWISQRPIHSFVCSGPRALDGASGASGTRAQDYTPTFHPANGGLSGNSGGPGGPGAPGMTADRPYDLIVMAVRGLFEKQRHLSPQEVQQINISIDVSGLPGGQVARAAQVGKAGMALAAGQGHVFHSAGPCVRDGTGAEPELLVPAPAGTAEAVDKEARAAGVATGTPFKPGFYGPMADAREMARWHGIILAGGWVGPAGQPGEFRPTRRRRLRWGMRLHGASAK